MKLNNKIKLFLTEQEADFIEFVDISNLSSEQNKSFATAILFGVILSPQYLYKVSQSPDYVEMKKINNSIKDDEFCIMEQKTDLMADLLSSYLTSSGYLAYSQSEKNIEETGFYNNKNKSTPLPHKTIAVMAGLGWIGKHNLLVSNKYGSGISMCSVLTNAPLKTTINQSEFIIPQCGECNICTNICETKAIKGNLWKQGITRNEIIDVFKCTTCLKCMVHCPFTQKYINLNHK